MQPLTRPAEIAGTFPVGSPNHRRSPAIPPRRVVLETSPAGDNTDTATIETVRRMAGYIRKSMEDPAVQAAAEYAWRHFAYGRKDAAMLWWAAFWYVKHCVKFRVDEATLFRIGAKDEFDLLIAPDVLVRMKDPAEDCDGFTMLVLTLLSIMAAWFLKEGTAPVYIATVAAGPEDPKRWSHVFGLAVIDGQVRPLDASHGTGPGWMVPRERIYRFQAWDLNGRPVDITPARFQGFHGYVRTNRLGMGAAPPWPSRNGASRYPRRRGFGQDDSEGGISQLPAAPSAPIIVPAMPTVTANPAYTIDWSNLGSQIDTELGITPASATTAAAQNVAIAAGPSVPGNTPTTNWLTPLMTAITGATQVATLANLPAGYTLNAAGQVVPTATTLISSYLPIVGIGLLALFAINLMSGKK